ncbi:MAG: ABC transporter substrate-binding protein [Bacillota bacterium]
MALRWVLEPQRLDILPRTLLQVHVLLPRDQRLPRCVRLQQGGVHEDPLTVYAPFLGGDTWEAPEFITIGGDAVEGVVLSTHYSVQAAPTDAAKKFVEAYKLKYNKEPNAFAALGYDAYLVIIEAIKSAGKPEPVLIRDNLAKTKNFKGVTGTITMDENRDANKSAVILQVKGGKFQYLSTVEPF